MEIFIYHIIVLKLMCSKTLFYFREREHKQEEGGAEGKAVSPPSREPVLGSSPNIMWEILV